MAKKEYRFKNDYPRVEFNSKGFPKVYCHPGFDYESLHWARFGSGGEADARHCFVDDWRIEHLWRRPGQGLLKAVFQEIMTGPDYTIEKDCPLPLAEFQIWRSAVITKYWQDNGVHVVPVLQWSDAYPLLCLKTIIPGSVVSVRGPQRGTEESWLKAAEVIQEELRPYEVLHFGNEIDVWENPVYLKLNSRTWKREKATC